jgi:hypothetical protein
VTELELLKYYFPGVEFTTEVISKDCFEYKGVINNINIILLILNKTKVYQLTIIIDNVIAIHIVSNTFDDLLSNMKNELIIIYNSSIELLKLMGILN